MDTFKSFMQSALLPAYVQMNKIRGKSPAMRLSDFELDEPVTGKSLPVSLATGSPTDL